MIVRTWLPTAPVLGTQPVAFNVTGNTATTWPSANGGRGSHVTLPFAATITHLRVACRTAASGNISLALYNAAGTTRLATTGAVACPTANTAPNIALTTAVALQPGTYFAFMSCDNTTAQFVFNTNAYQLGGGATATSHPAPTSVTIADGTGTIPVISLIAA